MNDVPARVWVTRTVLVGFIVLSFQMTIATEIRVFGVVIQIVLAFAVAAGAASGPGEGAKAGFVLGLMYDLASGFADGVDCDVDDFWRLRSWLGSAIPA